MQENNTMDTKIIISSEKSVLLAGNQLDMVQIDRDDFIDYQENGYNHLSYRVDRQFYPQDFNNEDLLHFEAKVIIELTEHDGDVVDEYFTLDYIKAYTMDQTEISLTKEEYQQAYKLIENAVEF